MISILNEVTKLRRHVPMSIDYTNSNRYRVVINEMNGTATAYYFNTPIYNNETRKAVDFKFHKKDGVIYSIGSSANITYSNQVRMENTEGYCTVSLGQNISAVSANELMSGNNRLYPTTNGFMYKIACIGNQSISFDLEVGKPFMEVRANDKYFSLMSETFRPFVTVSCIGTVDDSDQVIAPTKIAYQRLTDRKYRLIVTSYSPLGKGIMLEANLHEAKLVQDTTVESANPKTNNAFGGTAFIGNTTEYGEQWLYSRLDFSKLSELEGKQILKAVVHFPKYNRSNVEVSAFKVSTRFCSFGSTWDNKIPASVPISNSEIGGHYQSIDLTTFFADKSGGLSRSEGFILKSKIKGSGFSVIATGDSYYAPQIYEFNIVNKI